MKNKVYHIVSEIFGVPIDEIDEHTSANIISSWDSLAHLNLILALEEEFNVDFLPREVSEMLSVRAILTIMVNYDIS